MSYQSMHNFRHQPQPASHHLAEAATIVVTLLGIAIPLLFLALTVGPRILPYQVYTVLSGSMEPTIPTGSTIILVPASAQQLSVGDIITMAHPEQPGIMVTHRIIKIQDEAGTRRLVTQGDANNTPDSWTVVARGDGWRYVFGIPFMGYLLTAMQSQMGRVLFVVIPAVFLGVLFLIDIWKPKPTVTRGTT